MTIREALALGPGSIVTLNRLAGEPVDLLVNGKPIARGEVVVIDEEFGLRVTEVLGARGRRRARRRQAPSALRRRYTGGVHRAARAVAAFWRKAYEDSLTGLAAMVAYNLLLSIFPLALIALFVAGRVLRSPGAGGFGASTTRSTIFPTAAESTLVEGIRRLQQSSTTVGIVAHRLLAVGRRVLLGRARHRVLPHLPPALPHVGAPEAVRLRDARGRAAVHRRERRRADRAGAAGSRRARPAVRPRRRRATSSTRRRSRSACVGALRRAVHHLRGGAQGRDPVVAACGRARSARRSRWASSTPPSRSTCRTSRRCGSARARSSC